MAAGAWTFYNEFKRMIGDGTLDMDTDIFKMALFTSASNATVATLSTKASITNEVANANGYLTGGKSVTAITWATGASAGEYRWDATADVWSASGGSISIVRIAVIYQSNGQLVAYSELSTAQFSITDGNTLTVTPNATNGIFELNG
jgi:hypothetical protein